MFQYVAFTDGTTTLELTNGINYALVSYAPGVAPLKESELGGEGPYENMVDTITFHALGCTAAEAYAAAAAVNVLLDQAQRWWNGENVSAVRLLIQAQGSALDPLQVIVKGHAPGASPNVSLQPTWSAFYGKYIIQNIATQFRRRGQWLSPTTESAASANTSTPLTLSSSFASSATVLCPVSLEIAGFNATNDMQVGAHMVLWTPTVQELIFKEAEALASGNFTSVVEATARSGNILRFTPASTSLDTTSQVVTMGVGATQQRIDIYAMIRNNDTTKTYQIRARCIPLHSSAANDVISGSWVPIDGSTNFARPIALGSFVTLNGWSICFLEVIPSATGGTLDIDYLVFQCRDIPSASGAVAIRVNSVPGYGAAYSVVLSDNSLDGRTPTLLDRKTSGLAENDKYLSYQGDLTINQIGSTIALVWMSSSGTKFGQRNNADSANVSVGVTATRRPAYLVPQ